MPTLTAASQLLTEARKHQSWITSIRRQLHEYPELGYQEVRTSEVIRAKLDELSVPYRWPVAKTGVVAQIGRGDGPCVALRADIDALPIHEEADVDFRSRTPGKMYACGHDCHTAMLLGAAKMLKAREAELPGVVKLVFQPAEEGGAGGNMMCEEGALENPAVERIFGLHVWPQLATGSIGSRPGVFLASAGSVTITVQGKGGHAAKPNLAIDPVATAAKIVCELQTIVSREVDPLEPAVVSITSIHGGEAYNVIPPEVKLIGTIRSLTMPGLEFLQKRVRAMAEHVATANRCTALVEFPGHDYPPTVNDAYCWDVAQELGREALGEEAVVELPPTMGGEDFAYYANRVPGCFVALGVRNEAEGAIYGVHHPKFKVDESALPIGSALHTAFALRSLAELHDKPRPDR